MKAKNLKTSYYVSALLFLALIVSLALPMQTAHAAPLVISVCASGCDYTTIQAAIDVASTGDTISVAAGTYSESVNIDTRAGLTIIGEDPATTIIKPSTTLPWNVASYGSSRQTVLRVVNSTNITVSNFTIDLDLVKGNNIFVGLYWDSTGNLDGNTFKNNQVSEALGGYYEIGLCLRAPGYTDISRAAIVVNGNTFQDLGRVALLTHDYVDATITGNTFLKTVHDFGYGIELGSASTGVITGNTFYGFDTPAASDGSTVAGLYIENSFTSSVVTAITKHVTIDTNNFYNNQLAIQIGNEWNGLAGNVDIVADLTGNNIHDNVDGAVRIADEDKEAGSSVTANFTNNTLTNNGDIGYDIYTFGDGDLTVNIQGGSITGHDYGVYMNDWSISPSGSTYNIKIEKLKITGNLIGIQNDYVDAAIDATSNWWGAASGPGTIGPGSGDPVSENVTYNPWCSNEACTNIAFGTGTPGDVIQAVIASALFGTVIELPAGTIEVPGGFLIENPGVTIVLDPGTILIPSSPCFTVTANDTTITGGGTCTPTLGSPGILVSAPVSNLVISGITIDGLGEDTADGIAVNANVTNLWIKDNTIKNMDSDGIHYASGVTVTGTHELHGNRFQDNTGLGINNETVGTFNARYNWWGHTSGPGPVGSGSGQGVSTKVVYDPWCADELCIPPTIPSSFYGYIYMLDGVPSEGDKVDAYLGGMSGVEASATIISDSGSLAYQFDVLDGVEGETITFKIGTRVVATSLWHGGTYDTLNIHPPKANPGGPYYGLVGASISFSGSADDSGGNIGSTYAWDMDNNGSYETIDQTPSNDWASVGEKTVPYKVTDSQGGVGTGTATVNIASITLGSLLQTYDGSQKSATAETDPTGLTVGFTYEGSSTAPTNAGSYTVVATISGYTGSVTDELVIEKATATVTLGSLIQVYDGTTKSATATTVPTGLTVNFTYDPTPPINPGLYAVVGTIDDLNYEGTKSGTLNILAKQSLSLVSGWNLVSFNLVPVDTGIATVLASIAGNYDLVYAWDGTVGSNNWKKYAPGVGFGDTLLNLDQKMGFWIHMKTGDTLDVTGNAPTTTEISLSTVGGGWNMVGYPKVINLNLPAALSEHGVGTDFTLVYAYHAAETADPWKLFDRSAPGFANDLKYMSAGWGYWVKVSVTGPWHVEY